MWKWNFALQMDGEIGQVRRWKEEEPEIVEDRASQETEDEEKEAEMVLLPTENIEQTASQKMGTEASERPLPNLLGLTHRTDPTHVPQFHIKYDNVFIQMCANIWPCQPVLSSYPKNEEGWSFQKKWYENNPWLEYSPSADAMFCSSCRLFVNDEKYTSSKNWKKEGFTRWRKAFERIKEHNATEFHLCGMVRWNTFKKNIIGGCFWSGWPSDPSSKRQRVEEE